MQYNPEISHLSQLFQGRDVLGILKENSMVMQLNSCQYAASQTDLAPEPSHVKWKEPKFIIPELTWKCTLKVSYPWAPAFLLSHFCKGYLFQPPSPPPAQTCTVNKSGSRKLHVHQRWIFWKAQSQHHRCTSVRPAAGCKFLITDGWAWLQSPRNHSLSSY